MPIELRRWFIALAFFISAGLALACFLVIRRTLSSDNALPNFALVLLSVSAIPGLFQIFKIFLSLVILKLFPGIE